MLLSHRASSSEGITQASILDGRSPQEIYQTPFPVPGHARMLTPDQVSAIYEKRAASKHEGGKGLNVFMEFFGPILLGTAATLDRLCLLEDELRERVPVNTQEISLEKLGSLQYGGIDPRRLLHYLALTDAAFDAVLADEPIHALEMDHVYYVIGGNTKATAAYMRGKTSLHCQVSALNHFKLGEQTRMSENVLRQLWQFEDWARQNAYAGRRVYAWDALKQQFIKDIVRWF